MMPSLKRIEIIDDTCSDLSSNRAMWLVVGLLVFSWIHVIASFIFLRMNDDIGISDVGGNFALVIDVLNGYSSHVA
jgi:hypothetical protein